MIEINGLRKVYRHRGRDVVALDDVDLRVGRGEILGVVGRSGAGKSTLIRCVNLLERPTAGDVVVGGTNLTRLGDAQLRAARRRIGMIFQHFNLLDSRTVADNVAFPLELAGMSRRQRSQRVEELLDLVGLEDRAGARPARLSGGQKQRVGIARALAAEPSVLLCDEATSALDPETTRSILALLKDLNAKLDLTILLITHEMQVVKQICDSAALLHDGRLVESGAVADLVGRGDSVLARELLPRTEHALSRDGARVVEVTMVGSRTDDPVIATLVRRFDIDVNVLSGAVETIGGTRVGRLRLELPGSEEQTRAALDYLSEQGLRPEEAA
jgi:D-methionine transport system ATP-binding protein